MPASASLVLDAFVAETARRIRPSPLDIARLVPTADWARLPTELRRRFAANHPAISYAGRMTLHASTAGLLFAQLARLFGAPLPTRRVTDAPVVVDVRPTPAGVAWERQFGPGQRVRSVKSPRSDGTIVEQTDGGLGMLLDVSVDATDALVFTSRSFYLALGRWRLPIPMLLTPGRCRVEHRAVDPARFRFTLTMTHPLWGTTFHQTGIFTDPSHPQ